MSIVSKIQKLAASSAQCWDMAVDTAGPEYSGGSERKASEMQDLADECESAYDSAIEAIERDDMTAAIACLEQAKTLEAEGGDASHAIKALQILGQD